MSDFLFHSFSYRKIFSQLLFMDNLSEFSTLFEPVDSYALKYGFLAAYPTFLIIGYPNVFDSKLYFPQDSYIKIPVCLYENFFHSLTEIGNLLVQDDTLDNTSLTTIKINVTSYDIEWTLKEKQCSLGISNHPTNKTNFAVDFIQFSLIISGFQALFFKPLFIKYYLNFAFYRIFEKKNVDTFKAISLIDDAVSLTKSLNLNLTEESLYEISLNILRYKKELLIFLSLKDFPAYNSEASKIYLFHN